MLARSDLDHPAEQAPSQRNEELGAAVGGEDDRAQERIDQHLHREPIDEPAPLAPLALTSGLSGYCHFLPTGGSAPKSPEALFSSEVGIDVPIVLTLKSDEGAPKDTLVRRPEASYSY